MTSTRPHSRAVRPYQPDAMRKRSAPVAHERFLRPCNAGTITSSMAGKLVPLAAIGLHREDGMRQSRFAVTVQMDQTAAMLINAVRVTARAVFVPKLAFKRFKDMGSIDRSFNGEEEIDGNVIPWFEEWDTSSLPAVNVLNTLGLHPSGYANTDYLEAYNLVWNHLAQMRSPSLELREMNDASLAPAFWSNSQLKHVVPTFDDALLAGEVPLTIVDPVIDLQGFYRGPNGDSVPSGNIAGTSPGNMGDPLSSANAQMLMRSNASNIFGELRADGIAVSLANIDLAKQTAAWARLRTQFSGVSEDWMIDQLLSGVRVRDENLNQPIELDMAEGVIGMTQRFATDAENLDQSMTDGSTILSLSAALPPVTCGGVFMIVGQVLPEMQYERQRDFYLSAEGVQNLPERTADELDPQPVELVRNSDVDSSHGDPDGLFGYRPLNGKWVKNHVNIGGKYYRSSPSDPWAEDRNRIWTPEVVDPALGPDFYLANTLSHDVFVDREADPFEWWLAGTAQIEGLTYFGPALREALDDYDKVLEKVDVTRLKGDGTDVPETQTEETEE